MSDRTKAGFTMAPSTKRALKALSIVCGKSQSDILERAVEREVAELPKAQRDAIAAVSGTPRTP